MARLTHRLRTLMPLVCVLLTLLCDGLRFLFLCLRPSPALAAENLFLRRQLALYQERHVQPRHATNVIRLALVWLARWFDRRQALVVVQPATLIRWHRQGFRLFWRWKSALGRPPIPPDLQTLIRRMTCEHATWGKERIASELLLKLGLRVSPRTVRKYMPKRFDRGSNHGIPSQCWVTFVRNHAQAIVDCDFCTVVMATFRLLYVFVLMEHATRRILHCHITMHPTAQWTRQQLREAMPADHEYRYLIHDRDSIFSADLDQRMRNLGLRVLKTPVRSPQANSLCERLLCTLRRECLDLMIPLTKRNLHRILHERVCHYNAGRPHMASGPGIPQPPPPLPLPLQEHRHRLPEPLRVVARSILGGLHHDYGLATKVA
jgi:putative transposase